MAKWRMGRVERGPLRVYKTKAGGGVMFCGPSSEVLDEDGLRRLYGPGRYRLDCRDEDGETGVRQYVEVPAAARPVAETRAEGDGMSGAAGGSGLGGLLGGFMGGDGGLLRWLPVLELVARHVGDLVAPRVESAVERVVGALAPRLEAAVARGVELASDRVAEAVIRRLPAPSSAVAPSPPALSQFGEVLSLVRTVDEWRSGGPGPGRAPMRWDDEDEDEDESPPADQGLAGILSSVLANMGRGVPAAPPAMGAPMMLPPVMAQPSAEAELRALAATLGISWEQADALLTAAGAPADAAGRLDWVRANAHRFAGGASSPDAAEG